MDVFNAYSKKLSDPAPIPEYGPIHWPFSASTPAPMSPMALLLSHTAQNARLASCSNLGSPVSRLNTVNSSTRLPAPALHVSVISGPSSGLELSESDPWLKGELR